MSNFFAALDDSGDEGKGPSPAVAKKKTSAPPKKEVVEPSKVVENRPNKNNRNTKGGRGGRPPGRDGKRQFDRRSGTGRGREIKKEGGGGHNWGNNKSDAKKAEGPVTEGDEEANVPEENEDKAEEAVEEEEVVEEKVEEPEDKTLSYEEYLATKQRPDSELFKPREERVVENEFSGKAGVKKVTEDYLVMGGGKAPKKKGTKKEEKSTLVLDFKVKSAISDDRGDRGRRDGRRDGGGGRRDGRGGGRGGGDRDRGGRRERGGRGGGRGPRGLDTSDANAFPSL